MAAVVTFCILCPLSSVAAGLEAVRFGTHSQITTVVFDMNGYTGYTVSGNSGGTGHIHVDFDALETGKADGTYRPGRGHIARYGFIRHGSKTVRAVLEPRTPVKINRAFLIPPGRDSRFHRLVLELERTDTTASGKNPGDAYPDLADLMKTLPAGKEGIHARPVSGITPPAPALKPGDGRHAKTVIVIDPGHGGVDPGAIGQHGTTEKSVNLAAALVLRRILLDRKKYSVFLTRMHDTTIRPARRQELARQAGGDLFISLHADAVSETGIRGASVYTVDEKGQTRSARIARAGTDFRVYDLDLKGYDRVVGDILFDQARDSTTTASERFARKLIDSLEGKTPLLNRSHREADFRVLLAPDVPAVLFEMAFISNIHDEKNLNSPGWRKEIMESVADAIDRYFEES